MAEQKKQTGKKRNYKGRFNFYEVKGDAVARKNKVCPKCGPGAFLAIHKDRLSCGGCGYTEKTGAQGLSESGAQKEENPKAISEELKAKEPQTSEKD